MKKISNFSLQQTNSFGVESIAPIVYFPSSIDHLVELANKSLSSFYILGEGFNTLFVEENAPIIIKPEFKGIEINEQHEYTLVTAAASENWHQLVQFCIDRGINGLENLALIPGSVGAAPIQNIGAYGVELAQYCKEVTWFDFKTKQTVKYSHSQCKFSYRESVFKNALKNKGLITSVTFQFPKAWQANLSYAGLEHLPRSTSAKQVMHAVIKIRQSKLPDPLQLPNAGSFFKNPMIEESQWQHLIIKYPDMPSYPQNENAAGHSKVKIAAGWLIDEAGLKGHQENGVGVHKNQALVIVNYSADTGLYIANLALTIRSKIKALFNINLEPEVRAVFSQGEYDLTEGCKSLAMNNKEEREHTNG